MDCCGSARCCEASIRTIADLTVSSGLKDAGDECFHLDDCSGSKQSVPNGTLVPDPTQFQLGFVSLIDYIDSEGLKA